MTGGLPHLNVAGRPRPGREMRCRADDPGTYGVLPSKRVSLYTTWIRKLGDTSLWNPDGLNGERVLGRVEVKTQLDHVRHLACDRLAAFIRNECRRHVCTCRDS